MSSKARLGQSSRVKHLRHREITGLERCFPPLVTGIRNTASALESFALV